jgi:hypothetical protein
LLAVAAHLFMAAWIVSSLWGIFRGLGVKRWDLQLRIALLVPVVLFLVALFADSIQTQLAAKRCRDASYIWYENQCLRGAFEVVKP